MPGGSLGFSRMIQAAPTEPQPFSSALLRQPTLRQEAQSTSALEGTYAPLEHVLGVDADEAPVDAAIREVFNSVIAAEHAVEWVDDGRPLTVGLLESMQRILVNTTAADTGQAGHIRTTQVDRKSTRLNSSHLPTSRMPSSA